MTRWFIIVLDLLLTAPSPRQRLWLALPVVLTILLMAQTLHAADASDVFLETEQAFALTVERGDKAAGDVRLHWQIAPGYYLYRDRIGVAATPARSLGTIALRTGDMKEDPNFGKMEVYHDELSIPLHAPGARELSITWQGCAEAGLCYPPQTRKVQLDPVARGTGRSAVAPVPEDPRTLLDAANANDTRITELLGEYSLALTLPLFFLLGVALAFTPCVLPMLPIVSGIVVGSQAPPRRAFALSLAFVLAMALTYALLGAAAAVSGANLQALLQNRWTVTLFSILFVVLALAMFGFFTLQLPALLRDRLDGASRRQQGGTLTGAASLGLLSALFFGPCMTAPLAGTLLYIAQTGKVMSGALLLFALGLGMGVPLLAIGALGARCLPKPGLWMERVKGMFGFVLLAMAVWMAQRIVPEPMTLALWGALMAGMALTLGHLARQENSRLRLLGRGAALVAGLWGCAMVLGASGDASDPLRPLARFAKSAMQNATAASEIASAQFDTIGSPQMLQARLDTARADGQPVLVDFSADWCASCRTIDREVFADAQVRGALAGTLLLRVDVTAGNPEQRALMREYQVQGPPTVILFDARGRERRDARLVGEFRADDLLQRQSAAGTAPEKRS